MSEALLLDMHVALWWMAGDFINDASRTAIDSAALAGALVMVSPISAWEVGLAAVRGRVRIPHSTQDWYARVLATPGFAEVPLTADILVASEYVPEPLHRDPADRFLVSTARIHGPRLVTRYRKILEYGAAGHVLTLAC